MQNPFPLVTQFQNLFSFSPMELDSECWWIPFSPSAFLPSLLSFPPHLSFVYLPWPNAQIIDLLGFFKKFLFCLSLSSFFLSGIFPVMLELFFREIIENCSRVGKRRTRDFWKIFLCQINRPNCHLIWKIWSPSTQAKFWGSCVVDGV